MYANNWKRFLFDIWARHCGNELKTIERCICVTQWGVVVVLCDMVVGKGGNDAIDWSRCLCDIWVAHGEHECKQLEVCAGLGVNLCKQFVDLYV